MPKGRWVLQVRGVPRLWDPLDPSVGEPRREVTRDRVELRVLCAHHQANRYREPRELRVKGPLRAAAHPSEAAREGARVVLEPLRASGGQRLGPQPRLTREERERHPAVDAAIARRLAARRFELEAG